MEDMITYHKIETVYERDPKTKKLVIGKFYNPTIEYLKDNIWEFTEKVDGTNIRVYWDGHKVTFGARSEDSSIPAPLVNRLNDLFGGETNAQMFEQKFGETPVLLFGEGYGGKINTGSLYKEDIDFILFDVIIAGNFQPRKSIENIAQYFGIDVVPIALEGTLQEGVDYVLTHRESIIAKNGAKLEGLVGRTKVETFDRTGHRNIVKIKYRDFQNPIPNGGTCE